MTGVGDGGGDTCEGGGGPGWWETRVEATFDYATQSGEIRLYAGSE